MERKQGIPTDETLVKQAQTGNKHAEEELLYRYVNLVRFCARKFFLIGGESDDLIQEGMMGLHQAIKSYSAANSKRFKNYAYLCIWRQIIDAVKKASGRKNAPLNGAIPIREVERLLSETDPEETLIFADDRRDMNKMLSRVLTDMEFKVFTMYIDGASKAEMCEITGKSPKSVDNAVQRSKKKLAAVLLSGENEG